MPNLHTLATYPFLQEAKYYVKNEGATTHELLTDPIFEPARTNAIQRVENVIDHHDVGNRPLSTESDKIMELFSYPVARMITVCINDDFFTRRYALGEAVHMYKNLLREEILFIINISKEFQLDIKYFDDYEQLSLLFTQYLSYAPTQYKKWKMINRTLDQGYVVISKKDLIRILQEVLRKRIYQELSNLSSHPETLSVFSEEIHRFRNRIQLKRKDYETIPIGKLNLSFIPPCLKSILSLIQSGENVTHMGRFALVAFLNSLQLSTEEIIELFSKAPDFDVEKTRYQIEHILGKTGATSYKPPGCDKLKTYGICPSEEIDEICKKTHHPTSYYRHKWKLNKNNKK
jgi:DNA primase large subunit